MVDLNDDDDEYTESVHSTRQAAVAAALKVIKEQGGGAVFVHKKGCMRPQGICTCEPLMQIGLP